ncbi:MAG: maleylacetoacetate isomerase [Kofleriaceae bacterium]|nr:maleylacetoacetate isomerase [Kofleriaceae bacterium]
MKLVLHNYWRSSASYRTRIGLALKQLAYAYVPVNLRDGEQHGDAHKAKNPLEFVPVLEIVEDDGTVRTLTQSLAILEYLDERWPEAPLLPRDAYLRARTRALAEIINSGIQPHQNLATLKRLKALGVNEQAYAQGYIERGLVAYERLAADVAGHFSVGDLPTLADCALIPQLYAARRFSLDIARFPLLAAIEERCLALPAFVAAAPDRQVDAVTS